MNIFAEKLNAVHLSDSDQDSPTYVSTARKIDSKWYGESDDEEKHENRFAKSREEKSLEIIEEDLGKLQIKIANNSWIETWKALKKINNDAEAYRTKFKHLPTCYLEFLKYSDWEKRVEEETQKNALNSLELVNLRKFVKIVQEKIEEFQAEITAFDDDEENETRQPEKEEEHDEEYYSRIIMEYPSERVRRAKTYEAISDESSLLGFEGIFLSSQSCVVDIYLEIESGKMFVSLLRWKKAFTMFKEIYNLVQKGSFTVLDGYKGQIKGKRCVIYGGMQGVLQKLWLQLRNFAQRNSPNDGVYCDVPYYENELLGLADSLVRYFSSKSQSALALQCGLVVLEIVGFRRPIAHKLLYSKLNETPFIVAEDLVTTIRNVAKLSTQKSKSVKMTIVCYMAYQLAQQGLYREGRDALLRADVRGFLLSDSASTLMVLGTVFNRAIAQLALSAFLAGNMYETYQLIGSIWSHDQTEVLLGQKIPPFLSEAVELKYSFNMVPPHLHIPYQHLELAAMLSALIIDTNKEAKNPYDRNQRDHQRYFYQAITRRIPLIGSASTTQERIGAAYRALKKGDFMSAKESVEGMAAWSSLPDGKNALQRYLQKLKECALRIFCLANRCNFSTFCVSMLATKYDLSECAVKDVLNIIISENDSLIAYWDKDEEFLFVDRSNTTRLQHLIIGTTNTVSSLGGYTERRRRTNEGRGRGGNSRLDLRR